MTKEVKCFLGIGFEGQKTIVRGDTAFASGCTRVIANSWYIHMSTYAYEVDPLLSRYEMWLVGGFPRIQCGH